MREHNDYVSSPLITFVAVCTALYGLTTPNPTETIWTCTLLFLILRWFWRRQQPGIILFCILLPFLEIHTSLIESTERNVNLDGLFFGTGKVTFWMSSFSLLAVAIGVKSCWSIFRRSRFFDLSTLHQAAKNLNQHKLVLIFVLSRVLSQVVDATISYNSSLRQLETYSLGISDALLMVLTIKFMLDRKHLWMMILIYGYLIGIGFATFFSNWKEPLFILLVASLTRIEVFNVRQALRLAPIVVPTLLFLLIWQSVKDEYRSFLNGGAFSQQVVVSQNEALSKFQELAFDAITKTDISSTERLNATYRRIGYLEYFSNAVAKVPDEIPHERGKLLQSNLEFALIPRFLSPNKGVKDDKAKVEKYTDFYFGEYGGSSFSLGHYCEAYIDWGPIGMVIQMFLYGVLGGLLFLLTLNRTASFTPLLSLGILWVVMKPWGTFQQDMVTLSGTVFWGTVCHLFLFLPFYRWVNGWIKR